MAWAGLKPPPASPYNGRIGPHRRFTWVRVELGEVKTIKNELGGTVNDVMLTIVAGALGRHLRRRGERIDGLELKAMVPVSVRAEVERGALGNRVAAMMAPLPVWCEDPVERLARVSRAMAGLKESGQAVGAQTIAQLGDFAPPTILDQAARLIAPSRLFNLVVTNVPGPQFPLYLMGRRLLDIFPMVPLARGQGIGIAIMSYDGAINFGLLADWDLVPDADDLAGDLEDALVELREHAGMQPAAAPAAAPAASPEKTEA
jgi:diacylglycerol O-acyltransferase